MIAIGSVSCRDLFDLSKDNIQIKEHKVQGILLSGVTEVSLNICCLDSFQSCISAWKSTKKSKPSLQAYWSTSYTQHNKIKEIIHFDVFQIKSISNLEMSDVPIYQQFAFSCFNY